MAENWYVYYPKSKVGEETIQFRLQDRAGNYYTTMVVDVQTFLKGRNRFPCANGESDSINVSWKLFCPLESKSFL